MNRNNNHFQRMLLIDVLSFVESIQPNYDIIPVLNKISNCYSIGEITVDNNFNIIEGKELIGNIKYVLNNLYFNLETESFCETEIVGVTVPCNILFNIFELIKYKDKLANERLQDNLSLIVTILSEYSITVNQYHK